MAIQYATENNLEELIGEEFAIVDFYSETCVPCKMFAKILEDISNEIPFINIIKVTQQKFLLWVKNIKSRRFLPF